MFFCFFFFFTPSHHPPPPTRALQSSVKALDDVSALDATFAIALLSFDTGNRERIVEQHGLLPALVGLLDPSAADTESTFADEHDLVVRLYVTCDVRCGTCDVRCGTCDVRRATCDV